MVLGSGRPEPLATGDLLIHDAVGQESHYLVIWSIPGIIQAHLNAALIEAGDGAVTESLRSAATRMVNGSHAQGV